MTRLQEHKNRLATLADRIDRLRMEAEGLGRARGDLLSGEDGAALASHDADMARAELLKALSDHFDEAQRSCPDHGIDQLVVTCPWCCKAWGYLASRVA